jgi:hypothetical protein
VVAILTAGCATSSPASVVVSPTSSAAASSAPTSSAVVSTAPVARGYHTMTSLGPDLGAWLFGGSTGRPAIGGQAVADAWRFHSSGWIRVGLQTPPHYTDASNATRLGGVSDVVYSPRSGRVIVLTIFEPDIWLYDVKTDRWDKLPAGERPALHGSRAAFDAESDRVVVFTRRGETWAFELGAGRWTRRSPSISPTPRAWGALAYDSASDRVILFGGEAAPADTWAYDINSDAWKELTPAKSPPARHYGAMAYEPKSDRMVLFGGVSSSEAPRDDTWLYDFPTNTWTPIAAPTTPGARGWHALAPDGNGAIVLFGGGADRDHFQADTWIYDAARQNWSPVR